MMPEKKSRSRPRVCMVTPKLVPYRVTFFEKLTTLADYEWLICHGAAVGEDGRPAFSGETRFPRRVFPLHQRRLGPFSLGLFAGLAAAVREWRPQVIILPGMISMLTCWRLVFWARRNRCRVLMWDCAWEPPRQGWARWLRRLGERLFYLLADFHLTYSSRADAYLEDLGIPQERRALCLNGLEVDPLLAEEKQIRRTAGERFGIDSCVRILYVGGLLRQKRVELLLTACARLRAGPDTPPFVCWIVGDGPERQAVEQKAAELGLDRCVTFFGRVIEGVDVFFAAADLFVLPGIGGLALNQALFWELPCVVSVADGTEDDLVRNRETGFRFTPDDADSLARTLAVALNTGVEQRRKMGRAGREIVLSRASVNQMVRTFHQTIDRLLAE